MKTISTRHASRSARVACGRAYGFPDGATLRTSEEGIPAVYLHLSPAQVSELIAALKPYAAKSRTAMDKFNELAIGASFRFDASSKTRVKVGTDTYILLGDSPIRERPVRNLGLEFRREGYITSGGTK